MKMQNHLDQLQNQFLQQYQILGLIIKNAFGGESKSEGDAIIEEKLRKYPVLNDVNDVRKFFERNNNG